MCPYIFEPRLQGDDVGLFRLFSSKMSYPSPSFLRVLVIESTGVCVNLVLALPKLVVSLSSLQNRGTLKRTTPLISKSGLIRVVGSRDFSPLL